MFSLSLVYWFFYYLRSDSQQTTNKARYDAICVQECPNFNIWGYGLRSKHFEGSKPYSKIILGLQATGSTEKNGVFSVISLVSFIDDVLSVISLYYFIDVIDVFLSV